MPLMFSAERWRSLWQSMPPLRFPVARYPVREGVSSLIPLFSGATSGWGHGLAALRLGVLAADAGYPVRAGTCIAVAALCGMMRCCFDGARRCGAFPACASFHRCFPLRMAAFLTGAQRCFICGVFCKKGRAAF